MGSSVQATTPAEYEDIVEAVERQNIEKAFDKLKASQSGQSKLSPYSLLALGKIYLELSQPAKSFEYFEKVLFSSTELDAEAKAGMSMASLRLGNITKAKKFSNEALNANPDLIAGKIAYALAYESNLDDEELEKIFIEAISASSTSTFAGRQYTELLMRKNKFSSAEKILKKTLISNKIDAPSLALYADIFWLKGDVKKSIKYRTDAEAAYRKAGNTIKADEMVAWLNFEGLPKLNELEQQSELPKLDLPNESLPSKAEPVTAVVSEEVNPPNRKLFEPLHEPEDMPVDIEKEFFTGSGSILANGHLILTNKHVVEDVNYIVVRNGLGETRLAKGFFVSETDDIAIIELENPFPSDYSLGLEDFANASTGEPVFVMGYPMAFTLGMFHPSINEGIVTNEAGFGETSGEFQISAVVNPGNSGGPIFNGDGKIIGIATGGINKKVILEEDGFIPDGINYGVSTDKIMNFIEQNIQKEKADSFSYDAETLYQYMRSAVVFIVGQKN